MTSPGQAALAMLEAFTSIGAQRFDVTLTDIAGGKVRFLPSRSLEQLQPVLAGIIEGAAQRQHNVIVRPRSAGAVLIQLDDLDQAAVEQLQPLSFLALRTSPGSYQAWVAVAEGDADFAKRLRKGAGADLTASGASRVSGSLNVKEKYAPAFPCVETIHARPGLVVTQAQLEALGVVAPPERPTPAPLRTLIRRAGARGWPDYQRCLEHPKASKDGRCDRSKADFTFCLLAIDWGWSSEETAGRLMQVSGKAQAQGEKYALRTAMAAAKAIERRQGRER